MEDDGTVTLMIRLSQISSMPFQVTVNVTAVGKYTVLYGRLISRWRFSKITTTQAFSKESFEDQYVTIIKLLGMSILLCTNL